MNAVPNNHELAMAVNTLTSKVDALTRAYETQAAKVDELNLAFQKGKGAIWLLVTIGGVAVSLSAIPKNIRAFLLGS